MTERLIEWVNDQLNKRGWSMRELARRSRLSSSYISAVLSGRKAPGDKFFLGIAQGFGVSVEDLERLADPSHGNDEMNLTELSDIIERLTPEERQDVLNYALFHLWKRRENEASEETGPASDGEAATT